MNIEQAKKEIGVVALDFRESNHKEWLRHWDNDKRIAVSIHVDLVKDLKENGDKVKTLGVTKEEKTAKQGVYTACRIVKYKEPVVASF